MRTLERLFANNRAWAAAMTRDDPEFFRRLSRQQSPKYMWIGCSDSRVPANQIVGLLPGEMFVHRNVANLVSTGDGNAQAAIQYAIEALGVGDIIVCGHYGCGGVLAALQDEVEGEVGRWLRPLRERCRADRGELDALGDEERHRLACERNVLAQVVNVADTAPVREAWAAGRTLAVHGWIYDIRDGLLRDLGLCITDPAEREAAGHRPGRARDGSEP